MELQSNASIVPPSPLQQRGSYRGGVRNTLIEAAAVLCAIRVLMLDLGMRDAADRMIDVLAALHRAARWTPAEVRQIAAVQAEIVHAMEPRWIC